MELPKVVKNPLSSLSSFPPQEKLIKLPNTSFPSNKYILAQNLSSFPNSITPKTHFKSNQSQKNPHERTNNLEISVPIMSDTKSNQTINITQKNPYERTNNLEISVPIMSDTKSNQTINITQKNPYERTNNLEIFVPTMSEIMDSSRAQNLDLQLQTFGPFFRITAKRLKTQRELGRAEGVIRVWIGGKILHLDSMRLQRETIGMEKSIFGIGLFIGAVAIRHGYDCGCRKAELLAINDSDLYHSKLVRFYKRLGFKEVYEVRGSSLGDLTHMLVWGGVGTRMDANLEDLMIKWCSRFKPATPNI